MPADFDWSQLADLSHAETFAVRETEMQEGNRRLSGSFYGSAGYRAVQSLEQSGFTLLPIGDSARVLWFGPFSRIYVSDQKSGVPFLSSAEMMEVRLSPKNLLSKALMKNIDRITVHENTILVSCSGTIGNVALCTKDHDGLTVSQHAIRVIPKDTLDLGALYVFLQSEGGQFLVKQNKSGSVIQSIYAEDVSSLQLPFLPRTLRARLTALIQSASADRVRANALLDEGQEMVQHSCFLPDADKVRGKHIIAEQDGCVIFGIETGEIAGRKWGNRRLNASFYHPATDALRARILDHELGCTLDSVLLGVQNSALRKREYVDDPEQGVPMLGGKQLIQIRPQEVKYLSNALTRNLKSETVQRGWTLVSCGGTLGRTLYVHQNYEGWAVSQDVMRLLPDKNKVFPGFIYAFISSPYGQMQVQQRGYGSVIPRLRDFQFNSTALRIPKDKGRAVHEKVEAAFELRAQALKAENDALALFGDALKRGRAYVEREWGADY